MPTLESLRSEVQSHVGQFICSEIHSEKNTKAVSFRHAAIPPDPRVDVPDVQGLRDFYDTFARLTLSFEDEEEDYRPDWIKNCLVVGEIPRSGNYLLVPAAGPYTGRVFEFEHDGFEFVELGQSLPDFVKRNLDLDTSRLTAIASHMRFVTPDENRQWWINELKDNRGNAVRTEA